jgi:hypothetical protein
MIKKVFDKKDILDSGIPTISIRWLLDEQTEKKSVVIDYYYQLEEDKLTTISYEWQKEEIEELLSKL